jgi:DNA-binding transcriptional ArsR family regulator
MKTQPDLTYMANLYMALADGTRLRLLSLMRDGEVCVGDLSDVLGESQPKISRHLAYLRNAGIVDTRRDGKWIYYGIRWPEDGGRGVLRATLEWLGGGAPVSQSSRSQARPIQQPKVITYAEPHISADEIRGQNSAHNEIEEFLL